MSSKKYREANRAYLRKSGREYYYRNKNRYKLYIIEKKYGLTPDQYCELLKSQAAKCAICEKDIREKHTIDHDHKTGEVRGILCHGCNRNLSVLDNTYLLYKSLIYLDKSLKSILGDHISQSLQETEVISEKN